MATIQQIREKYPQYQDLSDEQLARGLHSKFYSDMDFGDFSQKIGLSAPEPTLAGSFMRGAKSGLSSARTYGESLIGDADEAAKAGLARSEEINKQYPQTFDMKKISEAYNDPNRGLIPAAVETAKQAPYAIAEQLPLMGTMAAGAMAAPFLAPEAAVAALGARALGAAGAFAPSAAMQTGSNIERQAETQEANNQPVDINMTKAQLAGAGQGAIDVVSGGMTAGRALVSKMVGVAEKDLAKMTAAELEKRAASSLIGAAGKGAVRGAVGEVPGEVTQQMLERWQAGLPLTDEDAQKEYADTAFQTLVSTAPLGTVGGVYDRQSARRGLAEKESSDFQNPPAPPAAGAEPNIQAPAAEPVLTDAPNNTTSSGFQAIDDLKNLRTFELDDAPRIITGVTPEKVFARDDDGKEYEYSTSDAEERLGMPAFRKQEAAPAPDVQAAEVVAPKTQETPTYEPYQAFLNTAKDLKKYVAKKEAQKDVAVDMLGNAAPKRAFPSPRPFARIIRDKFGGIKTGSPAALELADLPAYKGLIHPNGKLDDLSQIPQSELNTYLSEYEATAPSGDGLYADKDFVAEQFDNDARQKYLMTPKQREAAQLSEQRDDLRNALGSRDIDVGAATPEEIAKALHALNEERYAEAAESDTDLNARATEYADASPDEDYFFSRGNEGLLEKSPLIADDNYEGYKVDYQKIQPTRRIAKIAKDMNEGRSEPWQTRMQIQSLADNMARIADAKRMNKFSTPRARGADLVREKLIRARRTGNLSEDAVNFGLWALDRNPNIAHNLGVSIKKNPRDGAAGEYNPTAKIINLFKDSRQTTTVVHEILHHTERMMPEEVQQGIRKMWSRAFADAVSKATEAQKPVFDDMLSAIDGMPKARERVNKAFKDGVMDYDKHYQLTNPSEFWAVNATDIMAKRYGAQTWIGKARQWLSEMLQHVKGIAGMKSDSPVIKALNSIMKGDGKYVSKRMLGERTKSDRTAGAGVYLDILKYDNPGGDWLESKQKWAEEDYAKGRKISGPVTAYTKVVDFPVSEAAKIEGANGEKPVAGSVKYDNLSKSVKEKGFIDDGAILIGVNHKGEPYILEGNNRVAVANSIGKPTIKAEVRYFSGGEKINGALTPDKLNSMLASTDRTPAGEQTVIPGAEKISDKQLAERKMDAPMRSNKTQKAVEDMPLFGSSQKQMTFFSMETTSSAKNIRKTTALSGDIGWLWSLIGNPWQIAKDSKIVSDLFTVVKSRATKAEHLSHEYVRMQKPYRDMPAKIRNKIADYARAASGDMAILEKEQAGDWGGLNDAEVTALKAMRKSFDLVGPTFVRAYAANAGIKDTDTKSIQQIKKEIQGMLAEKNVSAPSQIDLKRALNAIEQLRFTVPNYWPRIRVGDYWFNVVDKEGKTVLNDQIYSHTTFEALTAPMNAKVSKKATSTLAELRAKYPAKDGFVITHNHVNKFRNPASRGLDPNTINSLMNSAARVDGTNDEFYKYMGEIIDGLAYTRTPSFMKESQKIAGLPEQPHDDIIDIYTNMVSHIPARLAYENRWQKAVTGISKGKPNEQQYAKVYMDYINTQNGKYLQTIRLWTFYSAFSLKPLTPIANWGSVHTVGAPLFGQYVGTPRAHALLGKAFGKAKKGFVWDKENGIVYDIRKIPMRADTLKAAIGSPELQAYNAKDMQGQEAFDTLKGRMASEVVTKWEKVARWSSSAMGSSEQFARTQLFIATYEEMAANPKAREKFMKLHGADHRYVSAAAERGGVGSPESMADWSVQQSFFDAGKMNHSPWERGWMGVPTQFKGYGYKLLSTMLDLAKNGGPQGKITALLLLGMAVSMSGLGGAPEVEDIEKLWALFDPTVDFRTAWQRVIVSDLGWSQYAADVIINGAGNAVGVPIGRQFSMGGLLPNNADIGTLAGPAAAMTYSRIKAGISRSNEGQPIGAVSEYAGAIPGVGSTLRNVIRATSVYPNEGVRTATGATVIPPGEVTTGEMIGAALGVNSPRINREYDARQGVATKKKAGVRDRDYTTSALADLYVKRDAAKSAGDIDLAGEYQKEADKIISDWRKMKADKSIPLEEKYDINMTTVANKMKAIRDPRSAQLKGMSKFQKPAGAEVQSLYESPY